MAINNYTQLQTEIANYLDRTDLGSEILDFIKIAEGRLNRNLRLLQMEQESTTVYTTTTSRFIAYPTNFIELLDLRIKETSEADTKYKELRYIAPQQIHARYSTAGHPEWYTLRDQIEIDRIADKSYTLKMHFFKRWNIAGTTTSWLLSNYPDVYLYGSLLAAEPYSKNDQRMILWKSLFDEALDELDDLDQRSRDDEELSTDEIAGLSNSGHGYNITNG
jgi:hypothetical protein